MTDVDDIDFGVIDQEIEPEDAFEAVEEHRELFERVAAADLPISARARRVLELADQEGEHP